MDKEYFVGLLNLIVDMATNIDAQEIR